MVDRCCGRLCQWLYVAITVLGLLTGIGFALYGIVNDGFKTEDSSYLFILIVNSVFALVYVIKGIKYKDPYHLFILVLSVPPPVIYIIVDFITGHYRNFKEARIIIAVPFGCFIDGFGVYFFYHFCKSKEFMEYYGLQSQQSTNMPRFGHSSSNNESRELKKHVRTMKLFFFLISANLQIDFSASVFTLTSGYAIELKSGTFLHIKMLYLFILIAVVAVVTCSAGYCAIREEKTWLVWIFAVLSIILTGAGLYLMIKAIEDLHKPERNHMLSSVTTFTSVLMIFVRIVTCTGCYLASRNFGKGLKGLKRHKPLERQRLLNPNIQSDTV